MKPVINLVLICIVLFILSCANETEKDYPPEETISRKNPNTEGKIFFEQSIVADNIARDTIFRLKVYFDGTKPAYCALPGLKMGVQFVVSPKFKPVWYYSFDYRGLHDFKMLDSLDIVVQGQYTTYANCRLKPYGSKGSSGVDFINYEWQGMDNEDLGIFYVAKSVLKIFEPEIKSCLKDARGVYCKTAIGDISHIYTSQVYQRYK